MFSFNFLDEAPPKQQDMAISETESPSLALQRKAKLVDIPPTMCTLDGTFLATSVSSYNVYTVLRPDVSNYDLIPGEYEGGSKLWECSIDLAQYIVSVSVRGSVLELGCGHGVPGMCALLQGCHPVVFSDYNDYVCTFIYITYPNDICR